jgi:spore photoproduct lyase
VTCREIIKRKMSSSRIVLHEYELLDAATNLLAQQVGDGSIIKRFDKTPSPIKQTNVVCPHFLELKWAYGCPFDCAWCYLKGTFRFRPSGMKPVIKDYGKIELHTRRFLSEVTTPEILNTGEIADSLMWESSRKPFSKFIIPIFEEQNRHKVLFVTKSDNIKNLLEINPHNQVIMSFSLNADEVAKRWEKGAPSVDRRIEAGRRLSQAGYEVRIRIDPMVPIENWKIYYVYLVDQIFANFAPARITLGSLRGLQSTINGATDKSWQGYLKENSNWGKKVEFNTRYEMYATIIDQLRESYGYEEVALCKETLAMWTSLGMDYRKIKCNCVVKLDTRFWEMKKAAPVSD